MSITLRELRAEDEYVMRRMHAQLGLEGFSFLLAEGPWEYVLRTVAEEASGVHLPADRVTADFFVAEADGVPVGRVSIRHYLNDFLHNYGGHIGYAVAPEFRSKGYATAILNLSLVRLAELGVGQALVICEADNVASARVIEKCGGQFEDARTHHGATMLRYWVTTSNVDARAIAT